MNKIRHFVGAFVILAIMIGLFVVIYNDTQSSYGFVSNDDIDGFNVMTSLNNLMLITALNETSAAIYKLSDPTSSNFDILGALAASGIGVIKTTFGLLAFPMQISYVIAKYYNIAPIIISGLVLLITIYFGYLVLSAYLGKDT